MTATPVTKPRQMPKGGRKGGAVFPRVTLADALGYSKKLVSKTHTGPQPIEVVLIGVFGSKHEKGTYGMSALKQYGLMVGDTKTNFSAADLAKKIAASPHEEVLPLYRKAALKPTVFKGLFETFHSDTVSKAKLKQRAADLKVHPDETGNCVDLYIATMVTAALVTVAGDQITHLSSGDAIASPKLVEDEVAESGDLSVATTSDDANEVLPEADNAQADPEKKSNGVRHRTSEQGSTGASGATPRAVFNVNVTLDASLDVEKLEKQLALLRRYGAL
jgi:hypothetical protein